MNIFKAAATATTLMSGLEPEYKNDMHILHPDFNEALVEIGAQ